MGRIEAPDANNNQHACNIKTPPAFSSGSPVRAGHTTARQKHVAEKSAMARRLDEHVAEKSAMARLDEIQRKILQSFGVHPTRGRL